MNSAKRETLKKLVAELYAELGSGDAVIKRMGMARTTVYRLLHEAGVVLPDRNSQELYDKRKTLQGEKKEEAIKDYINGMELKDIFAKYHVSSASLYTALKDAGIPRRPHGAQSRRFKDEDGKEIVRLYTEEKLSQEQIAVKFKSSQSLISRVLREQGVTVARNVRGKDHGNWVGGVNTTEGGYLQVLISADDPMAAMRNRQGYVLEHRLVMARALGRLLTEGESIHHVNGDKADNRLENLQLRQGKHGNGVVYRCADCGSYNVIEAEIGNGQSAMPTEKPQRIVLSSIASDILDLLEIHPGALAELARVGYIDCK